MLVSSSLGLQVPGLIFSLFQGKIEERRIPPTDTIELEGEIIMKGNSATRGIDETFKAELLAKLEQIRSKGKEDTKPAPRKHVRIKADMQAKVDEYIEIDAHVKKLEAQLRKLREDIEPYMVDRGLTVVSGSHRGSISLQPRAMPEINARYTSYDASQIAHLLDSDAKEQCVVKVIDRDVLELLVKTDKVPKEVLQYKILKPTVHFIISHK